MIYNNPNKVVEPKAQANEIPTTLPRDKFLLVFSNHQMIEIYKNHRLISIVFVQFVMKKIQNRNQNQLVFVVEEKT